MHTFKTEPILSARFLDLVAVEVLSASKAPTHDAGQMVALDVAAIRFGSRLADTGLHRIHCNVEISTILSASKEIVRHIKPGIVVEIVERHDEIQSRHVLDALQKFAVRIRSAGGMVALDDVTPTPLERTLIRLLSPEILKADNRTSLSALSTLAPGAITVAERIETGRQASLAASLGADEIQGYWCIDHLAGDVTPKVGVC